MKKQIFIIYNKFTLDKNLISNVDNIAFKTKEKAIEYIESKLTKEEIEKNRKAKERNMQNWFEFFSRHYIYYIKVVDLI